MDVALGITRHWDAENAGCGELVVGLRRQLGQLRGGELLRVVSRGAGTPVDLPAWCRLTGHSLVATAHPVYIIRKRPQ